MYGAICASYRRRASRLASPKLDFFACKRHQDVRLSPVSFHAVAIAPEGLSNVSYAGEIFLQWLGFDIQDRAQPFLLRARRIGILCVTQTDCVSLVICYGSCQYKASEAPLSCSPLCCSSSRVLGIVRGSSVPMWLSSFDLFSALLGGRTPLVGTAA